MVGCHHNMRVGSIRRVENPYHHCSRNWGNWKLSFWNCLFAWEPDWRCRTPCVDALVMSAFVRGWRGVGRLYPDSACLQCSPKLLGIVPCVCEARLHWRSPFLPQNSVVLHLFTMMEGFIVWYNFSWFYDYNIYSVKRLKMFPNHLIVTENGTSNSTLYSNCKHCKPPHQCGSGIMFVSHLCTFSELVLVLMWPEIAVPSVHWERTGRGVAQLVLWDPARVAASSYNEALSEPLTACELAVIKPKLPSFLFGFLTTFFFLTPKTL